MGSRAFRVELSRMSATVSAEFGLCLDLPSPYRPDDISSLKAYASSLSDLFFHAEKKGFSLIILRKNHTGCQVAIKAGDVEEDEGFGGNNVFGSVTADHFISAAAGSMRTAKIIFGFIYTCRFCGQVSFDRPPAVLAKQLNSLDVSSKGRTRLFLGAKEIAGALGTSFGDDGVVDQNGVRTLIGFLSGRLDTQGFAGSGEICLKPRYERDNFELPLGIYFEGLRAARDSFPKGRCTRNIKSFTKPDGIDPQTLLSKPTNNGPARLSVGERDTLYCLPDIGAAFDGNDFSLNDKDRLLSPNTVFDFQDGSPRQIMEEISR